ncbi:MAG: NYN domain-containing protein, partial [Patescibacteria group bacterium]
ELGRFLVEHSDITDLVIVSGDADFQGLIEFARWQQKRVKVVSAHEAISGRILFDKNTEVLLV